MPAGEARFLNRMLNLSQQMLERDIGPERVNALADAFKAAAVDDPSLWDELYQQPHPYQWLADNESRWKVLH